MFHWFPAYRFCQEAAKEKIASGLPCLYIYTYAETRAPSREFSPVNNSMYSSELWCKTNFYLCVFIILKNLSGIGPVSAAYGPCFVVRFISATKAIDR